MCRADSLWPRHAEIDVLYVWVNIPQSPEMLHLMCTPLHGVSLLHSRPSSLFCSVKGKMNCVSLFVLPL